MNVVVVIGTRPEAIKLAPVILALRAKGVDATVLLTGQHKSLVLPALAIFGITPDYQVAAQAASFSLTDIAGHYIQSIGLLLQDIRPDIILVQGDTTTAFAAALAGYYNRIPVGHVEAGLRTYDPLSPFPEENHRRMITPLAQWHYAPSEQARQALLAENVPPPSIMVTGNTVIDAMKWILEHIPDPFDHAEEPLAPLVKQPFILVTAHRRENLDMLHQQYFTELNALAEAHAGLNILFVAHPNPKVRALVSSLLTAANIVIIEPLEYTHFIHLMRHCAMIVTDSGGVQEESAFLGKPALVIREHTERKELLTEGNLIMIGKEKGQLYKEATRLLNDAAYKQRFSRVNLAYGNGDAADKIVESLLCQ